MELELINTKHKQHIINLFDGCSINTEDIIDTYKCPCGKGTVKHHYSYVEGDGSEHYTIINCKECKNNYKIIDENKRDWSICEIKRPINSKTN